MHQLPLFQFEKDTINGIDALCEWIETLPTDDAISYINDIRAKLHAVSPLKSEPVDFVKWVKTDDVKANDYNPNSVAPPEMALLAHSILSDGYTQPVVAWQDGESFEVVDGFHRNRVCRENLEVNTRVMGYLPLVQIKESREGRNDRMASTIRHNRARGKHQIESMSDIVIELKRRNWADERICKELGMEQDEVLRLCQITGLEDLFKDAEFSKSWDIKDSLPDDDFIPLDDYVDAEEKEMYGFRSINTSDESRVFHTFDKWECFQAGFYANTHGTLNKSECEQEYCRFLASEDEFRAALNGVITEWKNSCEHYLTNASMNRIAWLGQASLCYATGIPSTFRGGFHLLTDGEQMAANTLALEYLNKWLIGRGMETVTLDQGLTDRQSTIY